MVMNTCVMYTNVIPKDYEWYHSHASNIFADWPTLQAPILCQFWPETGQHSALVAFTNMRHGPTEDISTYICRFETVITHFVGDHPLLFQTRI
jgi:hypothetical protein